jgi:uncharacterized protein YjbJ (UPF0337 family)
MGSRQLPRPAGSTYPDGAGNGKDWSEMTHKKADEAKGRAKEAVGALSGDKGLKREGKADRAAGSLKDKVDRVKDELTGKS